MFHSSQLFVHTHTWKHFMSFIRSWVSSFIHSFIYSFDLTCHTTTHIYSICVCLIRKTLTRPSFVIHDIHMYIHTYTFIEKIYFTLRSKVIYSSTYTHHYPHLRQTAPVGQIAANKGNRKNVLTYSFSSSWLTGWMAGWMVQLLVDVLVCLGHIEMNTIGEVHIYVFMYVCMWVLHIFN